MGKGRAPCCDKKKVKTGAWTPAEDCRLIAYINKHGHTNWRALPTLAGLMRCGKSCRLRWINYLRPDVKRGNFTPQEEQTIINLHNSFGNKWSKIASCLPGRTDNEIKNVWNTHLKKRLINPYNLPKEYVDSCTSSSISSADDHVNVQNALQEYSDIQDNPNPNEAPEFLKIESKQPIQQEYHNENPSSDSPTSTNRVADDDGKIEIPVDCDIDIWELFDSIEDEDPNLNSANNYNEDWFRLLEDHEVGVTSDHVDQIDYYPIWPSSPLNLGC